MPQVHGDFLCDYRDLLGLSTAQPASAVDSKRSWAVTKSQLGFYFPDDNRCG